MNECQYIVAYKIATVALFDRSLRATTSYQSTIVSIALSYTIFEIFDIEDVNQRIYARSELPDGENGVILRSLVLSQYQRVTDRRTDGRTDMVLSRALV